MLEVLSEAQELIGGLLDASVLCMLVIVLAQSRLNPIVMPGEHKEPDQVTGDSYMLLHARAKARLSVIRLLQTTDIHSHGFRTDWRVNTIKSASGSLALSTIGTLRHLVDQECDELPEDSVVLVTLLGLPVLCVVLRLVEVKEAPLLLEMLIVETVHRVEVVRDEENDQDPFEASGCLHAEDDHEDDELGEKQRLQDGVIAKQADRIIVLVQVGQVGLDLLSGRVDPHALLEAMIHHGQPSH